MENLFSSKMSPKSSAELEQIISLRGQYTDDAVLACLWVLKQRNELSTSNLELLEQLESKSEQEQKRTVAKEKRKKREAKEVAKLYFDFFTFRAHSRIVPGIIYANTIIYVAMLIAGIHPMEPSPYDLLLWGGNLTELSLGYQPWRLVTHIFLHGSVIHILMNMAILAYIGPMVEVTLGRKWFILAYLITGIGAGIASAAWNVNLVSVGASGSIFGLFGLTLSILITSNEQGLKRAFIPNILWFVGYNIVFGLTRTGIDNAAHIGGLITGMMLGFILGLSTLKNISILERVTQANRR
ncbi:rhomboid family intramembrane serine protease [Echinicola salinicaeni]|uniref:rhomboid family intramembrane serine protease n=1 Tax=Echinicola salinicaeni TaxID=2762757 RepID=UPI001648E637|nr:rhomboid family intramembrane serine protease [Echinicola salinicaeni]